MHLSILWSKKSILRSICNSLAIALTCSSSIINNVQAAELEQNHITPEHTLSLSDRLKKDKATSFYIDREWQNQQGNHLHLYSFFSTHSVENSLLDSYKVSYSLNHPIRAIHTYLSPRLEFAIKRINYYSADEADKIVNLKSAFINKDESNSSQLFWQAYNQYQDDAFYHLKISPCVHPDNDELPCVRPNYSQLFYEYKPYVKTIANQLLTKSQKSQVSAIKNAQEWVYTIPNRTEEQGHFFPPISVLKSNEADSDEKALLLATLVSQVAPQYKLYMLYPSASIGSVSPVWLTIDSRSGIKGKQITINSNQYTVLSGSDNQLEKMLSLQTEMTSESLY